MFRILLVAGLAGLLCACASLSDWGWLPGRAQPGLAASEGHYDFRWRLSGDRAVAPLQVFDDGRQTWLQFAPDQSIPAIFRSGRQGDLPLDFRRAGPYVVLSGVWPHLVLRGGHLRSFVERSAQPAGPSSTGQAGVPAAGAPAGIPHTAAHISRKAGDSEQRAAAVRPAVAVPVADVPAASALPLAGGAGPALAAEAGRFARDDKPGAQAPSKTMNPAVPASHAVQPLAQAAKRAVGQARGGRAQSGAAAPSLAQASVSAAQAPPAKAPLSSAGEAPAAAVVPAGSYQVGPADQNLRRALARWAHAAGWTFEPEHWAVDADIPVTGSARFDSGFKRAVQDLVASTELAEKPLQPCFYSNKVLRIVPYAQSCDRSADPARSS